MTAFNVVRFRVKQGREREFLDVHRKTSPDLKGFRRGVIVKTGDRTYCFVGEWASFDRIVAGRPQMIDMLDTFRHCLEDLGGGLGISDPVSGKVVLELAPPKPKTKRKAAKPKPKKKAAKAAKPKAAAKKKAAGKKKKKKKKGKKGK